MKVTGFTFIRNALKFDYPIEEAILSILPLCDNFIVAVGDSEDNTLSLISEIAPDKIKILKTTWDDSLREGGKVLAEETNKAFKAIEEDSDWAFYIQGDEVIHEKYHPAIRQAMEEFKDDNRVDGLLFDYSHFYGSYDYVGSSMKWYQHEIRLIKNNKQIYSYKDAQGFRKGNNEKLVVKAINAAVYHYGWVKEPKAMQRKQETFHKLWHDDNWMQENVAKAEEFDYLSHISQLAQFKGTHPEVMQERIGSKNWKFEYDISFNRKTIKERLKGLLKKYLNLDFAYKNYILK